MVRFFAISFPHFRHIFIYTGASVVTACALESYLPHSYREWLRIDELKTSILASDLLEEESPFFEQYSSHETLENLKHILFERLTAHIFDTDRSLEFYLAFFHTYGHGEVGVKRIAKLAIQRELPENFQRAYEQVYQTRFGAVEWDEESVKEHLGQLIDRIELTNDCIGARRKAYTQKVNRVNEWNDVEHYHDLDIDRPVLQLTPISTAKQITEQIKLIRQMINADDYVALQYLLEDGLVDTLCQVQLVKPELAVDVGAIFATLSASPQFNSYLKISGVFYMATRSLWASNVEMKSIAYKLLFNLSNGNLIKSSVYVGHPKSSQASYDFNLIFIHGLLGKSHRTWRAHDTIQGQPDHTDCWPIEWLPATLGKRSLKPRVILLHFSTSLSMYGQECVDYVSIDERARRLLDDVLALGLDEKPTVLIGHSMGGLLVKSMMIQANEAFREHIKGIVFYSTPHFGSKLAGYASNPMISKVLAPSTDVTELNNKAQHLPKLNEEFTKLTEQFDVLSFYEAKPIHAYGTDILVVEPDSANVGIGETVSVNENHIYVNKPVSRGHPSYAHFVNFILKVLA